MLAIALVTVVALFFAFMGVAALAQPERVLAQFDVPALTQNGRNEVRAVYGGFGLAIAILLVAALEYEALRVGVLVTVAAALSGMAGGRLISATIDRGLGGYAGFYFVVEALLAGVLLSALQVS